MTGRVTHQAPLTAGSAAASSQFAANRARGGVTAEFIAAEGKTRRGHVHEHGSLRVRFPASELPGLTAMLVNTAGGVAGGDRIDVALTLHQGADVILSTAAAEKIYRSHGPDAILRTSLRLAAEARLLWLPQETIVFDGAQVERRIDVELSAGASLALCEIVVFGRTAMGERMKGGRFVDHWRVRRDGRLIFADSVRLDGAIDDWLARPAAAGGGVAVATLLLAPGDEALAERLREQAGDHAGEAGVSSWNGLVVARFCAADASSLRADVLKMVAATGIAVPRLWLN